MLLPFHDDNPTRKKPWAVWGIVAVNLAVFLYSLTLPELPQTDRAKFRATYGFVPKRLSQFFDPKVQVEVPLAKPAPGVQGVKIPTLELPPDQGEIILTAFTCMFLHSGWFHLIGNMWFLWVFGNNVEDRLGHWIFLGFYLLVGLVATACHCFMTPDGAPSLTPIIGASGAVAGVLGAYAVTFPTARVKSLLFIFIITIIELPALLVLGIWFLMQLLSGMQVLDEWHLGGGVAWWAHVGGFLAGAAIMPLMSTGSPKGGEHWEDEVDTLFDFSQYDHRARESSKDRRE